MQVVGKKVSSFSVIPSITGSGSGSSGEGLTLLLGMSDNSMEVHTLAVGEVGNGGEEEGGRASCLPQSSSKGPFDRGFFSLLYFLYIV